MIDKMTMMFETKYYTTFEEGLALLGINYKPDGSWMEDAIDFINKDWNMDIPYVAAKEFYGPLGVMLQGIDFSVVESPELKKEAFLQKLLRLVVKSNYIIQGYLDMKNILDTELDTIKNTSVVKYNDTPTEEGVFTADKYTSNITQSESSSEYDINTKISVNRKKLNSLVGKYCGEFKEFQIWTN